MPRAGVGVEAEQRQVDGRALVSRQLHSVVNVAAWAGARRARGSGSAPSRDDTGGRGLRLPRSAFTHFYKPPASRPKHPRSTKLSSIEPLPNSRVHGRSPVAVGAHVNGALRACMARSPPSGASGLDGPALQAGAAGSDRCLAGWLGVRENGAAVSAGGSAPRLATDAPGHRWIVGPPTRCLWRCG